MNLDEKIGAGACAEIYRDGDKAIKLFNARYPLESILHEADNMARVSAQTGLPVPRMHNVRHEQSRWALVMDYVPGAPIFDANTFTPERLSRLISVQLNVHAYRVELKDCVHARLKRAINRAPLVAAQREVLEKRLDALPRGYSLLHGDFQPSNVLCDGEKYCIIDWQNSCTGAPAYDVARTAIILMGVSADMANGYLGEMTVRAGISAESVRAWLPLVAAERLGENQPARINTQLSRLVNQA